MDGVRDGWMDRMMDGCMEVSVWTDAWIGGDGRTDAWMGIIRMDG